MKWRKYFAPTRPQNGNMKATITEIRDIVETFAKKCRAASEEEFDLKPNPAKWSKKEVLGHLIDSGHNNLRRFITGQYESTPPNIVYEQDFWVKANDYQHAQKESVIRSWELINDQIARVLDKMPEDAYSKKADTGRSEPNLCTLEWLAADYVKHMKHHINQIFSGSFDVTYP